MKKTILLLFMTVSAIGQNFSGIVTYVSKASVDLNSNDINLPDGMVNQIKTQLNKNFEKTYTLKFNRNESLYTQDKQLKSPANSSGFITTNVIDITISGNIYKNIKDSIFKNEKEIGGKRFLIEDKLLDHNWEFTNESKTIGNYTVFKAIKTIKIDTAIFSKMFKDSKINQNDKTSNVQTFEIPNSNIKLEKKITAWYTPQIPVGTGPDKYWGLPGLILEVNDGQTAILCSKIILNPKKDLKIKIPKRGKSISTEEFENIMVKKFKESMEVMNSYRNKNSDNIFIGN